MLQSAGPKHQVRGTPTRATDNWCLHARPRSWAGHARLTITTWSLVCPTLVVRGQIRAPGYSLGRRGLQTCQAACRPQALDGGTLTRAVDTWGLTVKHVCQAGYTPDGSHLALGLAVSGLNWLGSCSRTQFSLVLGCVINIIII